MTNNIRCSIHGVLMAHQAKLMKRKKDQPGAEALRKKQPKSVTKAS